MINVRSITIFFVDGSKFTTKNIRTTLDKIARTYDNILICSMDGHYVPFNVPFYKLSNKINIILYEEKFDLDYKGIVEASCGYFIFKLNVEDYMEITYVNKVPSYIARKAWKRHIKRKNIVF